MIMMGLPTNIIDTNSVFYKDVRNGYVGGITMYERHVTEDNSIENLRTLIHAYQSAAPVPLLVSITQEGGQVNRLKPKYGFPRMPSAEYLGKIDDLDTTKYYADNVAYTLSRVGINVNFAPVLDVYSATNPVLGSRERTFSDNTDVIAKHARQFILSHNYFNVIPVVKHFPGHGSSTDDSHLGVTDVTKSWRKRELEPYMRLIKQGLVTAVMTAHIVNERLDDTKRPATLSKKIITDLLRKKMKFKGVVFSDDMHMKAISDEYSLKETIEMSIKAGVDVMLFSGNTFGKTPTSGAEIVNIVLQLIEEGNVSEKDITASYKRIMKMKNQQDK